MRRRKTVGKAGLARAPRLITVFSSPGDRHRGWLTCGTLRMPCALGRNGVTHLKREGDGATPAGRHRLLSLHIRRDRVIGPKTMLPAHTMRPNDGWSEDTSHGRYNCPIRLPSSAGHESMWREDHLYDVVGVLDWNLRPRIRGRGSAIFLHLCRPGFGPTAGCIALERRDLLRLLAIAGPRPKFIVQAKPHRLGGTASRRPLF